MITWWKIGTHVLSIWYFHMSAMSARNNRVEHIKNDQCLFPTTPPPPPPPPLKKKKMLKLKLNSAFYLKKTDSYHIKFVCDYAQYKSNQVFYLHCVFVWYMVVSTVICIIFFWIFSGAHQFPLHCCTNHIGLEVYWLDIL